MACLYANRPALRIKISKYLQLHGLLSCDVCYCHIQKKLAIADFRTDKGSFHTYCATVSDTRGCRSTAHVRKRAEEDRRIDVGGSLVGA